VEQSARRFFFAQRTSTMIKLRDTASIHAALDSAISPAMRDLIAKRTSHFRKYVDCDLSELVNFIIIEPGDTVSVVDEAVGFSLLKNMFDDARFGDPDFVPSFEWIQDHGAFFELVYILSDSGFGLVVLVPDDPGVEADIHMLCFEYADRPLS
jgi:hypothetical protein